MAERNSRIAFSGITPDQRPPGHAVGGPRTGADSLLNGVVGRLGSQVERVTVEQLSDDDVRERLAAFRRRVGPPDTGHAAAVPDDLIGYGYDTVRLWLRLVTALGHGDIGLADEDLDELTVEIVAQAVVAYAAATPGTTDALDGRSAFLAECVRQLGHAYRMWRMGGAILRSDELDELVTTASVGDPLTDRLRQAMEIRSEDVGERLRRWGYSEPALDEVLAATVRALALAEGGHGSDASS